MQVRYWQSLAGLLLLAAPMIGQQVKEAAIAPNRVVAVTVSSKLPADVEAMVARVGGKLISAIPEAGVLVAAPVSGGGAALIANLKKNSAVLDADYDRKFSLPRLDTASDALEPVPDFVLPHPLPYPISLPADFFYDTPQQWYVHRIGGMGAGLGPGPGAWDVTKGTGVRIAILDTGVNPWHPDVAPNLLGGISMTSFDPGFGPPNCEVPDPNRPGYDSPVDQVGHGTWTASLAAGAIGGGLVIGMAPEARLINIKVLRSNAASAEELAAYGVADTPYNRCLFRNGSGYFSWILSGMLVANQAGAEIISMSLGGFVPRNAKSGAGAAILTAYQRVANLVTANGSLVIASSGNSGLDLNAIRAWISIPAEAANVLAVNATTNPQCSPPNCTVGPDMLASYSNYGANVRSVSAPGGDTPFGGCNFNVPSCGRTGYIRAACSSGLQGTIPPTEATFPAAGPPAPGTSFGCFNGTGANQHLWYVSAVGTSAAAPLVSGTAALVKAANAALTPAQIRTILQQTAEDIGKPGYDLLFNYGLVNATAAVAAATK